MTPPRPGRPTGPASRPSRTTSRAAASRPRRLAGQGAAPGTGSPGAVADDADAVDDDLAPASARTAGEGPHGPASPGDDADRRDLVDAEVAASEPRRRTGLFDGPRVTVALLAAVVALTIATLGMAAFLWLDDDEVTTARPAPEGEISVPDDRPILIPFADAQAAASAAAEAATTAVSTSWQTYDEQLDEALATMTPAFAEEFRTTKEDAKAGIVESKVEVTARVVAQSVVRANASEVQALLFLNQYTTKDGKGTTYSPYRVLVTVVNTDGGWLVSDLETK